MSGIGHNNGPTLEGGSGWRRYAWRRARRELLPQLPIEVVRLRIRRAKELGIDYKSYASIRAANGRDIVALLFSSNALRVGPRVVTIPEGRAQTLAEIKRCGRLAMLHAPVNVSEFNRLNGVIDAAERAPDLRDSWGKVRAKVHALTASRGLPGDGVVVIGDTALEAEWAEAGRLGGFLPSEAIFGP
ncbi:hypothetical protein [Aliiroseovarius sp.]|uniref:hypothetical protein n=1 Tax=Aliiroseovarius sp. TaxID=1872442 RepID=UPI003BAAD4ED